MTTIKWLPILLIARTVLAVKPHQDQECPASGSTQIVYPSDCSKYYQCTNGNKELKNCPENLFFNVNTGQCDFVDNTDCQRPTGKPTVPTTPTTVTTPKTTTTTVNPNPDPGCPGSGSIQIVYPADCSKYYQCVDGHRQLKDCPESLYFNVNTGSCDFIDNTDCQRTTASPTVSTPTTTLTTPKTSVTPEPTIITTVTTPKPSTTTVPTTTVSTTTPKPTTTIASTTQASISTSEPTTTTASTTQASISTSKPTTTTASTPVSISTSKPTTTTVRSTTTTLPPNPTTDVTSTTPVNICYHQREGSYFPDPHDCAKFIECADEEAVSITCPKGTLWDESIRTCNFAERVDCHGVTWYYDNY